MQGDPQGGIGPEGAARERALRDILVAISQSEGDPGPVFETILENAARLCGAPFAFLSIVEEDGETFTIPAYRGDPSSEFIRRMKTFRGPIHGSTQLVARALREGEMLMMPDIADDDLYRQGDAWRVELVDVEGVRSVLVVPFRRADVTLGAIMLYRREPEAFSDAQIALVEAFAAQAAIALENVRRFREVQTRLEREKATAEILEVISQSRDDERPVFDAIVERAARLCDAQAASLLLADEARTQLTLMATVGVRSDASGVTSHPITSGHTSADAVLTGTFAHVHDVRETDLYRNGDPLRRELVDDWGLRTSLAVPLIHQGEAIGAITVMRLHDVRPFSDDDIRLLEGFAAQAVIAIENVRQFRALVDSNSDLTESLERQRATARVLDVISQSPSDVQPVFDAITETTKRLCEADVVVIWRVDADGFSLAATLPDTEARRKLLGDNPATMDAGSVAGRAFAARDTVHVEDMQADAELSKLPITRATGTRTMLAVPLFAPTGEPVALIALGRGEVRAFDGEEIALVETFADQAAIAIENVRLFNELQTRLEREAATREILQVISRSRDDDQPVFEALLKAACRLCGAQKAGLLTGTPDSDRLTLTALYDPDFSSTSERDAMIARANDPPMRMNPEEHIAARVICAGEVAHIEDLSKSELYLSGGQTFREMVEDMGTRTVLGVPVMGADSPIGAILLHRKEVRRYAADEIALVESFAAQAVIAIENVRQFRALQTRLEREKASREILTVISESRDDERPVFEVILKMAQRLCAAPLAAFVLGREGGGPQRMVAHVGATEETIALYDDGRFPMDPDVSFAARAIVERKIIHLEDMAETEAYRLGNPNVLSMVHQQGIRTNLFAPLISRGEGLGCLILYRREVAPFSPDQIALIETFAAQAVIAIENVRQFRELQERLERETATGEVLGVISESRDDDQPVFDVILENACRLCETPLATIVMGRAGDAHQVVAAQRGADDETLRLYQQNPPPMDAEASIAAKAIVEERVIHLHDMKDTEYYRDDRPHVRFMVDEAKVRSVIFVPLISKAGAIGAIIMFRREVRPFTDEHVALISSFAAQAVIAIENVRQFREVQDRLERETATKNILRVISRSRDDENQVFDAILESAARLCDAESAALMMVNEAGTHNVLRRKIGRQLLRATTGQIWSLDSEQAHAEAVRTCAVVHVKDLKDTDLYRSGDATRVELVDGAGLRTTLAAPIIQGERAIGAIVLHRLDEPRAFSEKDIQLLEAFAAQAVIAIENSRQFRDLQTRLEREAATGEVLTVISQSRDDDRPVFDAILENAARLCNAPHAFLQLRSEDDTHLAVAAQNFAASAFLDGLRANPIPIHDNPGSISVLGMHAAAPTMYEDVAKLKGTELYTEQLGYAIDREGMRTALFVPLKSEGESIGVIVLYRLEVAPFTDDEIALVETFAAQAVIAIENVRQFKALEALNAELGDRVQKQVGEIERMGRLKRFLSPQVADAVVMAGDDKLLSSHRALIAVLFCDMRGFTAFCETAEPEETIEVLQTYHEEMGRLIAEHGAGVDHRSGDGIMVIFNDPLPCDDPAGDALRLAMAMRARMGELCQGWRRLGHRLGFGVGISLGYATVGMVGSEGRYEYTASGTAVNLAARLCDEAADGDILLSPRAYAAVEDSVEATSIGEMTLKGIRLPVEVFRAPPAEG